MNDIINISGKLQKFIDLFTRSSDKETESDNYLYDKYNIQFNNLYTIANMPINRFGSQLISHNRFKSYMKLLKNSFSKSAYNKVMCRSLISIDYKGYVYDCDFNQLLGIPLSSQKIHIKDLSMSFLKKNKISVADHCYGCTAGSGSSCGGSLI